MAGDPGLQAERTAIAWTRTALSFAANGALALLRLLHDHHDSGALLLTGTAFALAGWTALEARRRHLTLTSAAVPGSLPVASLGRLAVGVALLGVLLIGDLSGLFP